MKILYISNSIIPSRAANSIHVMKMCQAFAHNGHDVVLLAPELKSQYEHNIIDIFEYYGVKKNFKVKKLWHPNFKVGPFFYTIAIFFYLIFNRGFNLVYGRFLHGCYISVLLKNKVIFESHDPIYDKKSHRPIIFKKLIKNKYFEKLIVISNELKKMYLERGFLDDDKIQVAHDGADQVINLNYKINLFGDKNKLKVGYVGHLYKGKGMEVIESISRKLDDDIEIHIIGGLDEDIKMWKEKITNKNVYFYGFVPHKIVSHYINSLDVCLLPNQKVVLTYGADIKKDSTNIADFTSPLKLFEYMSHKKPIVASDLPVIREVLNDKNSILVECDNIKLWISSIRKLKSQKEREFIANQSFKDFYKYTWKNRAFQLVENVCLKKN